MDELIKFYNEQKDMEDWTGQDGHDARVSINVIERVLEMLDIKADGMKNS